MLLFSTERAVLYHLFFVREGIFQRLFWEYLRGKTRIWGVSVRAHAHTPNAALFTPKNTGQAGKFWRTFPNSFESNHAPCLTCLLFMHSAPRNAVESHLLITLEYKVLKVA
jgi:hypothetical protein